MANLLHKLAVRNYRSLADIAVPLGLLNVFFGPNGAGKSSLLDTLWFMRDCAVRGVELASSARSHGIGLLWDGAEEGEPLSLALETKDVEYELRLALSSGRIEPFAGERLHPRDNALSYIERALGSDKALFRRLGLDDQATVVLREPGKLSLGRYVDFEPKATGATDLDRLLHFVHLYHARSFALHFIKQRGSEASHETWLWGDGKNLWSVLRNLHGRRAVDDRYDAVMTFMAKSFPSFKEILFEQTGPTTVYGSFLDVARRRPLLASGVSDGHLHMLLLLTALFAEGRKRDALMLFDEPEISLHPWALAVFAEAVKLAASEWNKQIFIATHSPVLLSQFDPADCFATELVAGRTQVKRLSEIEEVGDLLPQYAAGSLYMAELIAPQSKAAKEPAASPEATDE